MVGSIDEVVRKLRKIQAGGSMAEITFHLDVVSAEGMLFSGRVESFRFLARKVSWGSVTAMRRY